MFCPESSIIGSTNFKNGDHQYYSLNAHNQNGYKLDLNAVPVPTYSGRAMMPDIDVGSTAINGLGAANANFQQYISE